MTQNAGLTGDFMLQAHQNKLNLFIENFQAMKNYLPFRLGFSKTLVAFMFAARSRPVDIEGVERVKHKLHGQPIKQSRFRHAAELFLWTELALSDREDFLIEQAEKAYSLLREQRMAGAWVNGYIALQMAEHLEETAFAEHVRRLVYFKKAMRLNHKLVAGRHCAVLVSMLLLAGVESDQLLERVEKAYALIKEHSRQRLSNYTAAIVLALAEDVEMQVLRYLKLGESCKKYHLSVFNRYNANSLALLSFLPMNFDEMGEELYRLTSYLRGQKGFSSLYAPQHTVAILTFGILFASFREAQAQGLVVEESSLSSEVLELAGRAVLAVADDQMRRAESSQ